MSTAGQREKNRDRKRAQRERDERLRQEGRQEVRPAPAGELPPGKANGAVLGVFAIPRPGNAELGLPTHTEALYSRTRRTERPLTREQWLAAPREPAPTGIRVTLADADGHTIEQFGLRLWSDDPLDRRDILDRSDFLSEATGLPRNDVIERIHSTPPDGTVVFALPQWVNTDPVDDAGGIFHDAEASVPNPTEPDGDMFSPADLFPI